MAIPYNPSSFATNKTILQAIEELKNYLKDNPCYKVYYVNTSYVVGTYTYNLSDVDDPDDTMTEYDVVFFTNSYYAKVIVKDSTTFDIDPAVDFRGATGQAGADGISVSGATINASGHLIITLSDGNTIDAGSVVISYDNTVEITANSGTLSDDDYNKLLSDDSHIKYNSDVFYKNSESSVYIHFFHITSGGHAAHKQTVKITKATKEFLYSENFFMIDEDSITATNVAGEVLMSNGDGTASWGTVSSGYENTVSITATSGTFSDSDFAKLGYGDSTIVYTDAYSVSTVYKLKLETASILEFEAIDAASRTNLKLIDVNKTTKAYSMTSVAMIKSATFDSGTATSGKVLTANGSGGTSWETASASSIEGTSVKSTGESSGKVLTSDGSGNASWQTAGGGGSQLYLHNLFIISASGYVVNINFQLITTSSSQISGSAILSNLNTQGHTSANSMQLASGKITVSSQDYQVIGIYRDSSSRLGFVYWNNGKQYVDDSYLNYNITDTVITL